jgi:hypothetical protein
MRLLGQWRIAKGIWQFVDQLDRDAGEVVLRFGITCCESR